MSKNQTTNICALCGKPEGFGSDMHVVLPGERVCRVLPFPGVNRCSTGRQKQPAFRAS